VPVVYAGRDELTGKRLYLRKTFRGTKREAQRELARFITEVGDGHHVAVAGTFGELLDRWYEHAAPNWSPATRREHRRQIDVRIKPLLGDRHH